MSSSSSALLVGRAREASSDAGLDVSLLANDFFRFAGDIAPESPAARFFEILLAAFSTCLASFSSVKILPMTLGLALAISSTLQ